MLVDYFYWQYYLAPRWLLILGWNIEQALFSFFSVSLTLRTLLAPWHKDVARFYGGTLGELGLTIIWNLTSRLIGLIIRLGLLLGWLLAQTFFLVAFLLVLPLFLIWPWLVLLGLAISLAIFTV